MRLALILGAVTLAACHVPRPQLAAPGELDVARHPAVGCWELRAIHGRSRYLPTPTRARLDTVRLWPEGSKLVLKLALDSAMSQATFHRRGAAFAQWGPLRKGGIYLFWGDGFTGLDMRLAIRGDTMRGPSAHRTDTGIDYNGPEVLGARVRCADSTAPAAGARDR